MNTIDKADMATWPPFNTLLWVAGDGASSRSETSRYVRRAQFVQYDTQGLGFRSDDINSKGLFYDVKYWKSIEKPEHPDVRALAG